MRNDAAMTTLGGDSRASGRTLRSDEVEGGRVEY